MRLRQVGFFRELEHGDPDGPSLRDAVDQAPTPDRDHIAGYLRSGSVFAATGMGSTTSSILNARTSPS